MNKSKVSVIIPTYKRPNRLKNAVNSVLNQTYENVEIIVVDDNDPQSSDRYETERVMEDFQEVHNVIYIRHPKNLNGSAARNTGIKNASGEYIAFLDDDDEFLRDKIELQVKEMEILGKSYGIVYTKFIRKLNGKVIDKGIESRTGYLATEILKGTFFISAGSNILVRKEIVEKIGGFNELFLRRQDLEFLIRASLESKIAHVNKVCLVINKDDRSNARKLTEEQMKQNLKDYLEAFNKYIRCLSKDDQKKIKISQQLLIIRMYLFKGKIASAKGTADKQKIRYTTVLKYMLHLVKRKLTKQCYGFRI